VVTETSVEMRGQQSPRLLLMWMGITKLSFLLICSGVQCRVLEDSPGQASECKICLYIYICHTEICKIIYFNMASHIKGRSQIEGA
jgi:hypothetical protein